MSALIIDLPTGLKSKLAAEARRIGLSPEQFVQQTLRPQLQSGGKAAGPSLYDLTRDLCGTVNGGPRDLARNKKHLKGYGAWKR
jgi:hypothetical protein